MAWSEVNTLNTWEYVYEQLVQAGRSGASPADLLKQVRVNPEIPRRSSTYASFQRGFHVLRQLGWVRKMTKTAPSHQRGVDVSGVLVEKHFYTLTPEGRSATGWDNPQKTLYPDLYTDPERWKRYRRPTGRLPGRPRRPLQAQPPPEISPTELPLPEILPAIPRFKFPESFTVGNAERVAAHLRQIQGLGLEESFLTDQLGNIAAQLQSWNDGLAERIANEEAKDRPNEDRIDTFNDQMEEIDNVILELQDADLDSAINKLEAMAPVKVPEKTSFDEALQQLVPALASIQQVADLEAISRLENAFLVIERSIDEAAERASGPAQRKLQALSRRLESATLGFETMRQAIESGDRFAYSQGWRQVRRCCEG